MASERHSISGSKRGYVLLFHENDPVFNEDVQEKLANEIMNSPDCKIYGVSRFSDKYLKSVGILTLVFGSIILILALLFWTQTLSIIILAFDITTITIVSLVVSYLRHAHKYFKIFVSEMGIAKDTEWYGGAFPWEKIEFIEVKYKRDEIDFILFRAGLKKMGYRSSHLANRLTLDIISEYIGGIQNWKVVNDFGEASEMVDSDVYYMNPEMDQTEGEKRLEDIIVMEWIGEQDFDAYKTHEQTSNMSDEDLYVLIQDDPRCECLSDSGNLARFAIKSKYVLFVIIVSFGGSIAGLFLVSYTGIIFSSIAIMYALIFYGLCKGDEKLVMSPIGIARFTYGSPEALEWQHVEYVDLQFEEGKLVQLEFFGNQRRIYCPSHRYKDKFTMNMIQAYLPHLDSWEKKTRNHWGPNHYRLVRPKE